MVEKDSACSQDVTISLDIETADRLEQIAARQGITTPQLLVEILEQAYMNESSKEEQK